MVTTTLTFFNVKGKNGIMRTTACVLFIAQIAMALIFLSGLVDYFGVTVTALGAVELLISVANIANGAIFEYLLKCMVAIVYIVAAIIIVKNVIVSISYFSHAAFTKSGKAAQLKENSFFTLINYVGSTFKCCFVFIFLSLMASVDFTISTGGLAVFVIGLVCYIGSHCVIYYLKNLKLECFLYKIMATVIMLVAYVFLVSKLQVASFEQLVYGLKVVFGGYLGKISTHAIFSAIMLIAIPILYMILQFFIFSYISDIWNDDFYLSSNYGNYRSGKIMGMAIAITSVNFLVSMIMNNMETLGVTQMYKIIENELPMLIASITLFVCYRFEKFEEIKTTASNGSVSKQENKVEQTVQPVLKESVPTTTVENIGSEVVHLQAEAVEELKQYKELLNSGILTQEEFDAKKKEILGLNRK